MRFEPHAGGGTGATTIDANRGQVDALTANPRPAAAFPVGEYLNDELQTRGWTVAEFADRLGLTTGTVSRMLGGREMITSEIAHRIATALGTGPEVWLRLQAAQRSSLRDERA